MKMKEVITVNGVRYRALPRRPRHNPDMQQNLIYQGAPVHWKPSNYQEEIIQQTSPYPINTYQSNPRPRYRVVKREVKRNPADAATLVMVVALGVFVWYLYDNNMIKLPWGNPASNPTNPSSPGIAPAASTSGSTATAPTAPELSGNTVSVGAIVAAFGRVISAFEAKGYIQADWHNVISSEASPYDTVAAVKGSGKTTLSTNPNQGGADYAGQYANSMKLVAALPTSTSNNIGSGHNSRLFSDKPLGHHYSLDY